MANNPPGRPEFRMEGARAAILGDPIAQAIEQQIVLIEEALAGVPDLAFDLSKTLVESVCKTVLTDIGQSPGSKWDAPKLLKETTDHLDLLPWSHSDPAKTRDSIAKTIRGLHHTIQGLCELRNMYGMASHGRDSFSDRLDVRHAMLAAQAADTIVSFLYRIHRDARTRTPGARVHYRDYAAFNDAFDTDNEPIKLGGVELVPSRVLFDGDLEAYKASLNEYLEEQSEADDDVADATPGEPNSEAE